MEFKNDNNLLTCKNLSKIYFQGNERIEVLRNINIDIASHSKLAIIGSSGSGKSSLLNILGTLDKPTKGDIFINNSNITNLSDRNLSKIRNKNIGFVYQAHHLLPEFTAIENILLPSLILGEKKEYSQNKAHELLELVGLEDRYNHKPSELSGGEKQRVAIARALINNPSFILMDEPTGNLDDKSTIKIISLIEQISNNSSSSFVIVTHDMNVAKNMDSIFLLENKELHKL
jgi:lipoprotein-releasing system ATP-binding protein